MPSKSLFLQPCGSSVIKSNWPSKSKSLGVLSPFARSPGWGLCFVALELLQQCENFFDKIVLQCVGRLLSGSMLGLMVTSSKRFYATRPTSQVCCSQSPCPHGRPLLTSASAGEAQTLKGRAGSVSVGSPGTHKVLYDPYKCLWQVWGLILNVISPLLPSCWGFSFALRCGVSFFGGSQHSPANGCSAVSCNFGVLTGEDEHTSFYSTILPIF